MADKQASTHALKQRAQACIQGNQLQKALKLCTRACNADKHDAESWLMLAAINAQLGDLDGVIKCCRRVISLQADNVGAIYNLGVALQSRGILDEAKECFQKVTRLQATHAPAFLSLGEVFQQLNKLKEACDCYQKAINIDHGLVKAHFNLGYARYLQEQYAEAASSYYEVLKLAPNHTPTINNLGRVYEATGNHVKAIELYEKTLGLMEDKGIAYRNLGRVYFGLKNFDASKAAYLNAVAAEPNNPEAHIYLGQIYLELGDTEQAIHWFEQALKLDPAQRDAKYFLAIINDASLSTGAKTEYVSGLFDDYADRFDSELVNKLQYKTPQLIADAIKKVIPASRNNYDILDAGCGTGLCGPLFRDIARTLDGVDLSSKMIEKARAREIYDKLVVGELTESLLAAKESYDIIIAADVFVYIGELTDTFKAAYTSLREDGLFAFSTETIAGDSFTMRPTGRFAHSTNFITALAADTGFNLVSKQDCMLRKDGASFIDGTVYVLRKNARKET